MFDVWCLPACVLLLEEGLLEDLYGLVFTCVLLLEGLLEDLYGLVFTCVLLLEGLLEDLYGLLVIHRNLQNVTNLKGISFRCSKGGGPVVFLIPPCI